jgi:hypothetical protein
MLATVAAEFLPAEEPLPDSRSRVGPKPTFEVAPPLAESTLFLVGAIAS